MQPISRRTAVSGLALTAVATGLLPGGSALAAPVRRVSSHDPGAAARWMRTTYAVVADMGSTPPTAARVYAHCAVATYEALLAGMPRQRTLVGQLTGLRRVPRASDPSALDWPMVVAGAHGAVLRALYPEMSKGAAAALEERETQEHMRRRDEGVGLRRRRASVDFGAGVGRSIAAWAAKDGHAEAMARPYTPPTGDAMWQPTPPNFGTAIEPYCEDVRPMVLRTTDEVAPAEPVPFSSAAGSPFWQQAKAVHQQSLDNTDETRDQARFWTDNPRFSGLPAGHWMSIVVQAAEQHGLTLEDTVEAMARAGVALHDAFLNCWTWKYRYDLLRPVTYVNRYIDPKWSTWVNTPQFPEYTSGHSVASRAAAAVLTDLLGDLPVEDTALASTVGIVERTRRWESFTDAADAAARSRLYGGIHYPMGIEAGKEQGDRVGALVVARLRTRR